MNRSGTTTRPAGGKSVMLRWLSHLGVFGVRREVQHAVALCVNRVRTSDRPRAPGENSSKIECPGALITRQDERHGLCALCFPR
jgi:hypothetical protein